MDESEPIPETSSSVSLAADPTAATYITCTGTCLTPVAPSLGTAPSITAGTGTIAVAPFAYSASSLCWDPAIAANCPAGQSTVFPKSASIQCGDHLTPANPAFGRDPAQCSLMGVDPNLKTPYVTNYNLSVTHAFGNNLSLEVGYVGNQGSRLTGFTDVNACAPYDTLNENNVSPAPSCVRPYASKFPYYQFINVMSNDTRSNYNSLQATLTKRMSHGVSFTAGYYLCPRLGQRFPESLRAPPTEFPSIRERIMATVTLTFATVWTLTGTYNIPGINGFAQAFKGWQVNGIVTLQSSQPWLVNDYNNNFSGAGDATERWDFFGNPSDFKGTANGIPYCSGFGGTVTCTTYDGQSQQTSLVSAAQTATYAANCLAKAPDLHTLAAGGAMRPVARL